MKKKVLLLICLLLAAPPAALADRTDDTTPEAIRKQLEGMLIIYTEDHPDVQILKRRLDLAEQLRKRQNEEKARRQRLKDGEHPQGPAFSPPPAEQP